MRGWLRWSAVATILLGCASARRVGVCGPYLSLPGQVRITAVHPARSGESSCTHEPVEVEFEFTEDAPGAPTSGGHHFTVGAGYHPPAAWVAAAGLRVGTVHRALRLRQSSGPCSPEVFRLLDVDADEGSRACFR